MSKLGDLVHVVRGMTFKKWAGVVQSTHERSGKAKVKIVADMVWCAVRYGAGYYDYLIYAMWDMDHAKRLTILTRMANKKLLGMVNEREANQFFDEKKKFYRRFAEFLGREVLIVEDSNAAEFAAFFRAHQTIIVKPNVGWSGFGIRKLVIADYPSDEALATLWEELVATGIGVVDEVIRQHPALDVLNPTSVNSIRLCTFLNYDGTPEYIFSVIKMGGTGSFVDNQESGGLHCPLERDTGRVYGPAHTARLVGYDRHPVTDMEFVGFVVPMMDQVVALCLKAALVVPEIRYVGWDIAVTPDGPILIEGNSYSGPDFWQLPQYGDGEFGLRAWFKQRVPGF